MKRIYIILALSILAMKTLATPSTVYLSDLKPALAEQAYGAFGRDKSVEGTPLSLGGAKFLKGVGTHAQSKLIYVLSGHTRRFTATVGIDDEVLKYKDSEGWNARKPARARFRVFIAGKQAFDSGVMRYDSPPQKVDIPLHGASMITLITDDVENDNYAAHADWAEAKVTYDADPSVTDSKIKYELASVKFALCFNAKGQIVGIRWKGGKVEPCLGFSGLSGFDGVSQVRRSPGRLVVTNKLSNNGTVKEVFTTHPDGVRWTTEVKTNGKPFSAPFDTHFGWLPSKTGKFWTTWGGPYEWQDPLQPKLLTDAAFEYGAFFNREGGISLPIVTLIDDHRDLGLSIIESPKDKIINMLIDVSKNGTVRFRRIFNRLGEGRTWKSTIDLVAHAGDFRPGLGWMVSKYPEFFNAPNALANTIGGHGAYSGYEGDLDAEKLHRMGFTFNWKASIDFPYMGMFLPPVTPDQKWNRFAGGGGGGYTDTDEGRFGQTSINQLESYSQRMKAMGFHVLNYFNVTEFGGNISFPKPPSKNLVSTDVWKSPNDFLYTNFPNAILTLPNSPIFSWGGTVVMDPGDKQYQDFLIDQAQRHIEDIPSSDGICIDRMDWLTQKNPHADDGLSWIDGPVRSLTESWISLMSRLEPLMHRSSKVIFGNAMVRRPDLTRYLDGIYDEHGDFGYNLNTSAFLCLKKPNIAWTRGEEQLQKNPDEFIQRHLYMGAFMTAPLPGNDHTLNPSESIEKLYLDYGAMFEALRGREWVLLPKVVEVKTTKAKANVFKTQAGYIVIVAFGGSEDKVTIKLNGLPTHLYCQYMHPGSASGLKPVKILTSQSIVVPLVRGCAMLKLTRT